MEVGDKVYVVSSDTRSRETGEYTVSKVGKKYFEVEGLRWDKFVVEGKEHPEGYVANLGVRKDQYCSPLYWYPSKEVYELEQKLREARYFIEKNVGWLDDSEVLDLAEMLSKRVEENKKV